MSRMLEDLGGSPVGNMTNGKTSADSRTYKKKKKCAVCKKEFLGGSNAKYCILHKGY